MEIAEDMINDGFDRERVCICMGDITQQIFTDLGLDPNSELADEIIKFQSELTVVSGIINKEIKLMLSR